jgi:hypothetical protein
LKEKGPIGAQDLQRSGVGRAPAAGTSGATGGGASFERVASFAVFGNNADPSAETVDATADGRTLVYTDGAQNQVGFVDITDPAVPQPGGISQHP